MHHHFFCVHRFIVHRMWFACLKANWWTRQHRAQRARDGVANFTLINHRGECFNEIHLMANGKGTATTWCWIVLFWLKHLPPAVSVIEHSPCIEAEWDAKILICCVRNPPNFSGLFLLCKKQFLRARYMNFQFSYPKRFSQSHRKLFFFFCLLSLSRSVIVTHASGKKLAGKKNDVLFSLCLVRLKSTQLSVLELIFKGRTMWKWRQYTALSSSSVYVPWQQICQWRIKSHQITFYTSLYITLEQELFV